MKSSNGKCGQLIARIFAIFFVICLAECAAAPLRQQGSSGGIKKASGSCLSYGHSCWGAHGKRAGPKTGDPMERMKPNDGQNLLLSRYFRLNPENYHGQYDVNQDRKIIQQAPNMRDVLSNFLYSSRQEKLSPDEDYSEPQIIPANESELQEDGNSEDPVLGSNEDDARVEDRNTRRRKFLQSMAFAKSLKM